MRIALQYFSLAAFCLLFSAVPSQVQCQDDELEILINYNIDDSRARASSSYQTASPKASSGRLAEKEREEERGREKGREREEEREREKGREREEERGREKRREREREEEREREKRREREREREEEREREKRRERERKREQEREREKQAKEESHSDSGSHVSSSSFSPADSVAHSFSGSESDYLHAELKRLHFRFEDPRSIYSFQEKDSESLGYGLYGRVFKATRGSQEFAIKRIPLRHSNEKLGYCLNEYEIGKILHHATILKLHDAFYEHDTCWFVIELFPSAVTMDDVPDGAWHENAVLSVVYQLLSTFQYLIEHGVCHSDFDETNVMISFDVDGYRHGDHRDENAKSGWGKVKLIDFGLGKNFMPSSSHKRHQIHSLDQFKYCSDDCDDMTQFVEFVKGLVKRSRQSSRTSLVTLLSLVKGLDAHTTSRHLQSIQAHAIFEPVKHLEKIPF